MTASVADRYAPRWGCSAMTELASDRIDGWLSRLDAAHDRCQECEDKIVRRLAFVTPSTPAGTSEQTQCLER
jgi:hypothetical protein